MKSQLQALRKRTGYRTAEEFANRMGIPVETYRNYERGKSGFSLERAWEFADVLECSLDELAGRAFRRSLPNLDPADLSLVERYRSLDDRGRETVDVVIEVQAQAGDSESGHAADEGRPLWQAGRL